MTIANDGSSESGWVHDPYPNRDVWRYGTERPCNLNGRYVSILADYSTVSTPYEIALCQFAVLGEETPIVEEEIEICSNKQHADAGTIDQD